MSLLPPTLIGYFAFSADPAVVVGPVPPVAIRPVATTDPTWNGLLASLNMNGFWTTALTVQVRIGPPVLTAAGVPALDPSSDPWRYSQTPAGALVPALTPGGAARVLCTAYGMAAPVVVKVDANTWLITLVAPVPASAVFFSVDAVSGIVS